MSYYISPKSWWSVFIAVAALLYIAPDQVDGQARAPEEGGFTRSLGQPGPWDLHLGTGVGATFSDPGSNPFLAGGYLGAYRDLLDNPLLIIGVTADTYAGARGRRFDWGVRSQLTSPFFRLAVGADYNGLDHRTDMVISLNHPVRRGGLFGFGSSLRIDYLPGRKHSFSLNVELPFGRDMPMGRTRPREDAVQLEDPRLDAVSFSPPASVAEALDHVAVAAYWIRRFTAPYMDHPGWSDEQPVAEFVEELRELETHLSGGSLPIYPHGRSFSEEVRVYHSELDRAFCIAVSGRSLEAGQCTPEGLFVSKTAKEILLREVIWPYNRLLGQRKDEDTVLQFGGRARGIFVRWLHTGSGVPRDRVDAALWVFTQLLEVVEGNRRLAHDVWDDSRFVWVPLQYALTPEQHDSQQELDALIAEAVDHPFTDGNRVSYVINEQFHFQLGRMIHEAEDYHVLWLHDFSGRNAAGEPDAAAYSQVLNSYLAALVEKVRNYDRTGKLPAYMIFIDEWFYARRDARLWMELLEDPMGHELDLSEGFEAWEGAILEAQEELRQAVADSHLLQAEAGQYGSSWLRNRIKIHVSVTNRGDPSFWSPEILPLLGFPDNAMRDHRKVSFYDVTEEDPYRGRAMYTGMGVGEHYTSLNWEDRAVMLQGPAALGLKDAARELLLNQGFSEEEIPYHLLPRPHTGSLIPPPSTATPWLGDSRVLEIHNQTGYNAKEINVAKAILYTLMPPGSVIEAPDSLWNSGFWAGLLLGSALRGARVLIVAPDGRTAATWQMGAMAHAKELLIRLVASQQILGDEIAAAGGLLKTGIYSPEGPVTDIRTKLSAFMRTHEEEPFFRELFPLDPSTFPAMQEVHADLDGQLVDENEMGQFQEDEGTPTLHLKANFFASANAWDGLLSSPELGEYFRIWMERRVAQLRNRAIALEDPGSAPERMLELAMPTLTRWEEALPPDERQRLVYYLLLGSPNQNYRSMVMDGEVAIMLSGWSSIVAMIDLISILGQSVWVDDLEELESLLPDYGFFTRTIGHWVKLAL